MSDAHLEIQEGKEYDDKKQYLYLTAECRCLECVKIGNLIDLPVFTHFEKELSEAIGIVTGVNRSENKVNITVKIDREAYPHFCRGIDDGYLDLYSWPTPTMSSVCIDEKNLKGLGNNENEETG